MDRRTVLKGGLVLAATAHTAALAPVIVDPLLETIRAYQCGCDDFNRLADAASDDRQWDEFESYTFGPPLAKLRHSGAANLLAGLRRCQRIGNTGPHGQGRARLP